MKEIRWVLFNGGFALCIYHGAYLGNEGIENIAMFMAWFTIIGSLFLLSDKFVESFAEKNHEPSMTRWFDITFDVLVIAALVYIGWIITGVGYLIHLIFIQGSYDRLYNIDKKINSTIETDHY